MKKLVVFAFMLACLLGCANTASTSTLPDGYRIWVMSSEEVYVSDASNELLVGPSLRKVGVAKLYIVTISDAAGSSYMGHLRTSGYSLIERRTRKVSSGLTETDVKRQLAKGGEAMPDLLDFESYQLVTKW